MTMKYWMMIKGQSMHINLTVKIKMIAATITQLEQLVQVQYAITDVVVMVREVADHQVILIAVNKVNKVLLLFLSLFFLLLLLLFLFLFLLLLTTR